VEADILEIDVLPRDRLILATDGLTESLFDHDLERMMNKRSRAGAASLVKGIRTAALARSPQDDVSLVVVIRAAERSLNGGRMGTKRGRGRQAFPLPAKKASMNAWSEDAALNRMAEIAKDEEGLLRQITESKWQLAERERHEKDSMLKWLLALLDVVDAFERVFGNIEAKKELCTAQMNIWIGNFRTVYKLLRKLLAEEGVVPIENLGEGFDPRWNEPERVFDPSRPEGTIVKEVKRGYLWQGQILRKSLVVVTSTVEQTDRARPDGQDTRNGA
jgi:molecular chaperone GrpE